MIYHIITQQDWDTALANDTYAASSLSTEGFIHTSRLNQVEAVLGRYYKNKSGLLLLHIDETKLTAPLKFELAPAVNEHFPHIYGELNLDAVVNVTAIPG